MKSRGCYETPGGTILLRAHRAIESITLDREVAHLKDDLMPRYASLIYNGYWWSPERKALQALIDHTQQTVNGWVRLKLYKGNVIVVRPRFEDRFAVRPDHRHLRGRRRRLRPEGRRTASSSSTRCACASRPTARAARRRADERRNAMFGITEEQLAEFGMTFGRRRLHPVHAVHHRRAGLEVEGRQAGTFVLFFVLAFGMLGFIAKASFRNFGEFKCRNSTMFPWSRRPMSISTASASAIPCSSPTAPRRRRRHPAGDADLQHRRAGDHGRRRRRAASSSRARRLEDLRRRPVFTCRAIRPSRSKSRASPITTSATSVERGTTMPIF
jgi:hypothetical protein